MAKKYEQKKDKKHVAAGVIHITSTFNNTIITVTDRNGKVVTWASGGTSGFKGSKKSTPYAAQIAADQAGKKAQAMGMRNIDIYIQGPGPGKEAAMRTFKAMGFDIDKMKDISPRAHNGCRPPKRRRV